MFAKKGFKNGICMNKQKQCKKNATFDKPCTHSHPEVWHWDRMHYAKRRNITSASDRRQKVYLASRSMEPNLLEVMIDDLKALLNENQV